VKGSLREGEEQPQARRRAASGKEKSSPREGEDHLSYGEGQSQKGEVSLMQGEEQLQGRRRAAPGKEKGSPQGRRRAASGKKKSSLREEEEQP
jgi:hypothetical protein